MISWIQRTFQQHYRIVFMVLLVIVIVTFVFTIGAMPGGSTVDHTRTLELFGRSLTTVQEKQRFSEDANLSLQLRAYQGINSQAQFANYPYFRAAGLYLADELGIPNPTPLQVQQFIQTLPLFTNPEGQYDPQAYARFRDSLKLQTNLSEGRVLSVMMEDWRLKHVTDALKGPGYVNEADLTRMFEESETMWTVQTATLDLTDIKPASEPSDEDLQRWFDAQSFRYDSPEMVAVNYVEWRGADFTASVTATDDEVAAYFENNKARYQKPTPPPEAGATTPPPPPPETTLAEVREQVLADLIKERAARAAARAASEFAVARFNANVTPGTPQFDTFLNSRNVVLKTTLPFTLDQSPPGLDWTPQVRNAAFALTAERPISNELRTGDSTVILFFHQHIAPAPQPLTAVRDRVLADLQQDLRRRAIIAKGEEIRTQLNQALKAGKPFADAAKESGLEAKVWEKFKRSTPPADLDRAALGMLTDSTLGEVAPMSVLENVGTFVLVAAKDVPTPESAPEEFAKLRDNMASYFAEFSSTAVLDTLVTQATTAAGLVDPEAVAP